jgi:predicted GNAT family N-acyltransferase
LLPEIRLVDWYHSEKALSLIRATVFIEEQHVPPELEWDGLDHEALHLLASNADGEALGCARILSGGVIGRMAVLAPWRGRGVGMALLGKALQVCHERGWRNIRLSAQIHAITFYEKAGFVVCSDEYLDAGITHRDMFFAATE